MIFLRTLRWMWCVWSQTKIHEKHLSMFHKYLADMKDLDLKEKWENKALVRGETLKSPLWADVGERQREPGLYHLGECRNQPCVRWGTRRRQNYVRLPDTPPYHRRSGGLARTEGWWKTPAQRDCQHGFCHEEWNNRLGMKASHFFYFLILK